MTAIMGIMAACKFAITDIFGEHSLVELVSNVMKLCDYYAAKNSKFIAYSLIFIGCIGFIQ